MFPNLNKRALGQERIDDVRWGAAVEVKGQQLLMRLKESMVERGKEQGEQDIVWS